MTLTDIVEEVGAVLVIPVVVAVDRGKGSPSGGSVTVFLCPCRGDGGEEKTGRSHESRLELHGEQ